MKYKIIAIDLDGTLVDSKKNISDYTCRIIRKYMEKGGIVVLASGRPTYGILPIAEKLKLEQGRGYILSYNGGELFECSSKKVIFQQTMPEDAPGKLSDFAKENGLSILTYTGTDIITETPDEKYTQEENYITKMRIVPVENFTKAVNFPVVKCLITGAPEYMKEREDMLKELYGEEYTISRSAPYFLEVQSKGIDKGKTLQKLAEMLDIDMENVAAFGDSYNDLSMLNCAGLAVAMENAAQTVKLSADAVAPSNDDDGVAVVVERMMTRKLVVFDLDGTLNKTECFAFPAIKKALEDYEASDIPDQWIYESFGAKDEDTSKLFFGNRAEEIGEAFWERVDMYTKEMFYQNMEAYKGAEDLLCRLRQRGYMLAICSNAEREYIEMVLKNLKIRHLLDEIEPAAKGEHKEETLGRLMKRVHPYKAVMVGDRFYDSEAAKANNISFIGCLYGYGKEEMMKEVYKVDKPEELYKYIVHILQ